MVFNFNRKTVFLTYAQTSFDKNNFLAWIKTKQEVSQYIIAEEKHASGDPHMHVFLHFTSQVHTRNIRYFDYQGKHPNIATTNKKDGIEKIKKYCMKGGDYISDGIQILGKREALFRGLLEEGLSAGFVRDNPEIMAMNFSSIKSWVEFAGFRPQLPPRQSLEKQRHIWISGVSNTGKSYWLNAFVSLYDSFEIPRNNDWSGAGQYTEVIYFDEYKGQLTAQALNNLCDGFTRVNTKGGSSFLYYPRVVICSNYSIADCYQRLSDDIIDTLKNRFREYTVFPRSIYVDERDYLDNFPLLSDVAVCKLK